MFGRHPGAVKGPGEALLLHGLEQVVEGVAGGACFGLASLSYRDREYLRAAGLFGRAAETPQLNRDAAYNQACSFALGGQADRAFEALATSVEAGYANKAHLAKDADLASLRSDARWSGLVARL